MKVQRNGLIIILTLLLSGVFSPQQAQAQFEYEIGTAVFLATMGGAVLPGGVILPGFGGVWTLVSVPVGAYSLVYGAVAESTNLIYIGTSSIVGGVYLARAHNQKPLHQFLGHYGIWLGIGAAFATFAEFEEIPGFDFEAYLIPGGAGIRYTF